jgi:uncharacterized protein
MAKLKNKDLILLLLHVQGTNGVINEPISGQTRLMKMIFLFCKEIKKHFDNNAFDESTFPDFQAYDFGPYAPKVYSDLEWLVNMGFIDVDQFSNGEIPEEERREFDYWTATGSADDDLDTSLVGKTFTLSERGQRFVRKMLPQWDIGKNQMDILSEFKSRCLEASLRALLHYTYTRYPEMTRKSKIRRKVLGHG